MCVAGLLHLLQLLGHPLCATPLICSTHLDREALVRVRLLEVVVSVVVALQTTTNAPPLQLVRRRLASTALVTTLNLCLGFALAGRRFVEATSCVVE